jgi:hypothetical protein
MQRRSLSLKLKSGFNKWRVGFLVFLAVYSLVLLVNLEQLSIQWDEANHLNGGLLLLHGHLQRYMQLGLFYPPLDDLIIAGYFGIAGANVFVGRLLSVTFAVLAVGLMFEFTYRTYGPKTALLASIFLATMPGFIWASRLALLETMLVFFFSASLMLFYVWLRKHNDKFLVLSGVTLGLGFLTKYQVIIAIPIMLVSILFLCRGYIKTRLTKYALLIVSAVLITLPWIVVSYQIYSSGMLSQWMYALQVGNPDKVLYGMRFGPAALPFFYLIEMVWPYGEVHPISVLVYAFALLGLGFMLWRRKPLDKFLLLWFFGVYLFFTLIGNRQWRYVMPIFPVLALSAASLISFAYDKAQKTWQSNSLSLSKKSVGKIAAVFLIAIVVVSVAYSSVNAIDWISNDNAFNVPAEEAVNYVADRLNRNESLMVLCPLNVFSRDIVMFYLHANPPFGLTLVEQYPDPPVDAYTPHFKVDELISLSREHNVKYLLLFEYGETYPYFNSTLTAQAVYQMLLDSQQFTLQKTYGEYPCKIFVFSSLK